MPRTPQNNDTRLDWSDREVRTERPGGGRRRVPRTHVIILDGTMSFLHKGYETHAGMLYKLLSEEGGHLSLYYEPGLQWSDWRETWSIMTGHGIDHQVRRAYGYLAAKFHADDDIYFFGYSRGAYAVRSLAGMIDCQGLLTAKNATERNVRLAFRHYRDAPDSEAAQAFREAHCHSKVRVEMVGVWDTVRALGLRVPLLWRLMPDQHGYHNHALGSTIR